MLDYSLLPFKKSELRRTRIFSRKKLLHAFVASECSEKIEKRFANKTYI